MHRRIASLSLLLLFAGCSYAPERALLEQTWAVAARERLAPKQRGEIEDGELQARWKQKSGDGWGVVEVDFDDAQRAPAGSKVVVLIPEGSHAQVDPCEFRDVNLEIVGKGIEKSRLVLDAGERGLVMNGGKLTVKNCTVSCYTSEGLTMLGGDVMLENCQINGSRHGIYVSEGRLEAKNCFFLGNESGIDIGDGVRLFVDDSVFQTNWDGISGERPSLAQIRRCMILGSVNAGMPLRLGDRTVIRESIICENSELGWQGVPSAASIKNCLIQDEAFFTISGLGSDGNRPLARLVNFPAATPQGVPKAMSVPAMVLLRKKLEALGTGEMEERTARFAEDEATRCLVSAEDFAKVGETRKARILKEVAEDFLKPYPKARGRLQTRRERLQKLLAAEKKP